VSAPGTRLARAGAAVLVTAVPNAAWACPLCLGSMSEANRLAFLGTMVLLTSLPVIMIGGLIFWIAKRASAADLEATPPEADAPPRPDAPRLVESPADRS
jgi:hypothetical protein